MKTSGFLFGVSENVIYDFFTTSPSTLEPPEMFSLPVFVGLDYHQKIIRVCVMDQDRNVFRQISREAFMKKINSAEGVTLDRCLGVGDELLDFGGGIEASKHR